jgi:hypothetical protein
MRRSCSSCFDVVLERLKKNMRGENGKRHASRSTVTLFLLSRATSFSKKTREFCSCVQNRKEQPGEYMLIDMGRLGQRSKWPTATYHDAYDRGPVARTLHLRKEKAEKDDEKPVNQLLLSILPARAKSSPCLYSRFALAW